MSLKGFLRKFNAAIGATTTFVLTIMIWVAFLGGDWQLTVHFNKFGEGLPELVLLSFGSLNALYWIYMERNDRVTHDYRQKIEDRVDCMNP